MKEIAIINYDAEDDHLAFNDLLFKLNTINL